MPDQMHVLIVRSGGLPWALPMETVEQAFDLRDHELRHVGELEVVRFRDEVLELTDLAQRLELESEGPRSAVVVWASGRRRALAVEALLNQVMAEPKDIPRLAQSDYTTGIVFYEDQVVPVLSPGAVVGAWEAEEGDLYEFTEMQQSALGEIANIGSAHAATALSTMIGRPVDVGYSEAVLTVLAKAVDQIGAPMNRSALVDTPIKGDGGTVLLVFPDDTGEQLCELLGTTLADEMGRAALQEVGNILSASYINAVVEMTGMELEPEPPTVEIDLLGQLLAQSTAIEGNPTDPTVLMRSHLTVEGSTTRFSFMFVPRINKVTQLLEALGVGAPRMA